jgi:hypothetical protein
MAVQWHFFFFLRATFLLNNTDDPSPKLIRISECLLYFNFKNQECAYNIAHWMPVTVWSFLHLKIGRSSQENSLWASHFCGSRIAVNWWPAMRCSQGFNSWQRYGFSLSHHVQSGRGSIQCPSHWISFPECEAEFYPIRRRFLNWFRCTINNVSSIVWTTFSITTLQKLCKVMPHNALLELMMKFTKSMACIHFGGRTEFLTNCTHLTNFCNISIIYFKFKYPKYVFLNLLHEIMYIECSQYSDSLWAWRLRGSSSSPGRIKNFLFSMSSRPTLGPKLPSHPMSTRSPFPKSTWQGREADQSLTVSTEVKKMFMYIFTLPHALMA